MYFNIVEDPWTVNPLLVPGWAVENVSGEQMITFVQRAVDAGGLAVFMFHGVGGEHIPVTREAHQELLAWLASHRDRVWADTLRRVMTHVLQKREAVSTR